MKVYYVTQGLKHGITYSCKLKNKKMHLLHVYLGAWAKIETVTKNHVW